jgi:NAD(P)H-flavin reductase
MMLGEGRISELRLLDGHRAARIASASGLIPAAGQYTLAHAAGSPDPLAAPLFLVHADRDGWLCAPPVPEEWQPGRRLNLRGPLGQGFDLPPSARRVAAVAPDGDCRRLLPLLQGALANEASVTLVMDRTPDDLPLQVEVQPMRALTEVCGWSEYAAFDVVRDQLSELIAALGGVGAHEVAGAGEVLVRAPMPCGALGECGVCTIRSKRGSKLACKHGPVFDIRLLSVEG